LDLSLLNTKACCVGWRQFGDACTSPMRSGVCAFIRASPAHPIMSEHRAKIKDRRRAGRPPAGAKEGERVKDYPQLSIRVPMEFKARLNALSAVTGLSQWRVIVEAINCFFQDLPATDRDLVDGLSERLMRAG